MLNYKSMKKKHILKRPFPFRSRAYIPDSLQPCSRSSLMNSSDMLYEIVLHLRLPLYNTFNGKMNPGALSGLEDCVFDAADKWIDEHPQYPVCAIVSDKTELVSIPNER